MGSVDKELERVEPWGNIVDILQERELDRTGSTGCKEHNTLHSIDWEPVAELAEELELGQQRLGQSSFERACQLQWHLDEGNQKRHKSRTNPVF